jgi:hypothetical protein
MRSTLRSACSVLITLCALPAASHEIYTGLKNKQGVACCDGTDCRPARYRVKGGSVQMQVEGSWYPIPNDRVDYRSLEGDRGETKGGHWCGQRYASEILGYTYLKTYCAFLPPQLTAAK